MNKKGIAAVFLAGVLISQTVYAGNYTAENVDELSKEYLEIKNGSDDDIKAFCSQDLSNIVKSNKEINITVDDQTLTPTTKNYLGVQCEFRDGFAWYYNDDGTLRQEFLDVAHNTFKVPVFRWGGGQAESINFWNNIGPYEERKPSIHQTTGKVTASPYRMGPVEWLKMMYEFNPDAMLLPCISFNSINDEDLAKFVQFLVDDKDKSEYGKMRAEYGIENPVKIYYWELGNEVDQYTPEGREWYIKRAKEMVEVIKKYDPDAKFVVSGSTAPWAKTGEGDANWKSWHRGIMPELLPYVDAMAFHPYHSGIAPVTIFKDYIDVLKQEIDDMIKEMDIRDADGNLKQFQILDTEQNRWFDWAGEIPWGEMFQSALFVSNYLNNAWSRDWYPCAFIHDIMNQYQVYPFFRYRPESGLILKTPTVKMYEMYDEYVGEYRADSSWEYASEDMNDSEYDALNNPYRTGNFSMLATAKNEDELVLILTNYDDYAALKLNFSFGNDYTLKEEAVLHAPNLMTFEYNSKEFEDLTQLTKTEKNEPHFTSCEMKPNTIVALTLKSNKKLYGTAADTENDDLPDAEATFSDTKNHWAKNEIEAFKNQGFVCSDTEFRPDEKINRAECASLVARVLGLRTDYQGSVFSDLSADMWCYGAANAMYVSGFMTEQTFRPQDGISIGEFCSMMNQACSLYDININEQNASEIAQKLNVSQETARVIEAGLLYRLYENGKLDPSDKLTRAEAVSVLYRLKKQIG